MNDRIPSAFTRRQFLTTGLTLASASLTIPAFLNSSAFGLPRNWWNGTSTPGAPDERILVVIQLGGGNDGLNTVVPYGEAAYYKARPAIGIPENKVVKLSKSPVGLHPALAPLADMYNDGQMSVVQGTGYPNPNRSHFKSMDIWHTADTTATGDGWLGKYFDAECCGFGKGEGGRPEPNPQAGIAIGREAPLAMKGRMVTPLAFESADLFRWTGGDVSRDLTPAYDQITRREAAGTGADPESNAAFLTRTALDAQVSSDTIRRAVAARPRSAYPQSELARQLQMVASMIHAKLSTRVYYVSMGGFDTHAGQGGEQGRHAQLLGQFAAAVKAFYADLKLQGNAERVMTMSFSEFGRRVGQNASNGTDHGTAAPMFLFGPMVKPGVLTQHPSLTDLDQGDLRYNTDFRSVYAGVLEQWMKADSKKILEGTFNPLGVLTKT
ncbi:MAG: DUF1501 domain-containing protein [Phycisphaeraceae bacterium]|nr:DUF1501 domain-containing protein [Phycisphaeraceae bacterium]